MDFVNVNKLYVGAVFIYNDKVCMVLEVKRSCILYLNSDGENGEIRDLDTLVEQVDFNTFDWSNHLDFSNMKKSIMAEYLDKYRDLSLKEKYVSLLNEEISSLQSDIKQLREDLKN